MKLKWYEKTALILMCLAAPLVIASVLILEKNLVVTDGFHEFILIAILVCSAGVSFMGIPASEKKGFLAVKCQCMGFIFVGASLLLYVLAAFWRLASGDVAWFLFTLKVMMPTLVMIALLFFTAHKLWERRRAIA